MMLDRGQVLDWFSSREIIVEAVLAGLAFYLFVVHMFTADRPFLPPALFKDRNFASAIIMVFCVSSVMMATAALLAPYLQNLAGYPVYTAGWVMAPRGIGIIASMFLAARMGMRVDQRKIMAVGLLSLGYVLYTMSTWTPDVTEDEMMLTMIIQGFSVGLVFNPLQVMAYTTLTSSLRGEATSVQSLARNIGSAIGISVTSFSLTRGIQATHADIAAGRQPVRPGAAGQRHGVAYAGPGDAPWRGAARPDGHASGADHRLQQRLPADDADHHPAAAAAAADAPPRAAGGGGGGLKRSKGSHGEHGETTEARRMKCASREAHFYLCGSPWLRVTLAPCLPTRQSRHSLAAWDHSQASRSSNSPASDRRRWRR